jgi:Uma2 family endonuclease
MSPDNRKDKIREQPLTYDDYAALPDDGMRYELVDGVLEAMTPAPSSMHQLVSFQLQRTIAQSCESDYIILYAPLDVILSPTEVRQPDLVMVHRSRIDIITKRGIEGPPDLVVEILSPYTIKRDRLGKRKTYARYRIPEYWIVDPASASLEQYVLQDRAYDLFDVYTGDEPVRSDHIPCVSFTMNDVMSRIPDLPDL